MHSNRLIFLKCAILIYLCAINYSGEILNFALSQRINDGFIIEDQYYSVKSIAI